MTFLRILIAPLIAACGASDAPSDPSPITSATEVRAGDDLTFTPSHLTVPVGTKVRWTNSGSHGHTVTSGDMGSGSVGAEFDGSLPVGESFEHTFETVGDHPYFCRPHIGFGMKGVVTVTAN